VKRFSVLIILFVALIPGPAAAQRMLPVVRDNGTGISSELTPELVVRGTGMDMGTSVGAPAPFSRGAVQATFEVTYIGFPTNAQAAFQRAVDIWASIVTSSVPIRVTARWKPLDPGVLGSASASSIWRDFGGAPRANTWYPVSLAEKLAGAELNNADSSDINANFSSTLPNWYLGTDGNTPPGSYDLVTVVLHELGHGLGFFGSMTVTSGSGSWGAGTGFPFIYDIFAENATAQQLITQFTNPSTALATQLTSGNVFFDGTEANAANGGQRPELYAPSPWTQGSSYSHFDEAGFPAGNPNSLMTPLIGTAEAIHTPGAICIGMFADWGWTVSAPPPTGVKWEEQFASTMIPTGWRVVDNDGSGTALAFVQQVAFSSGDTVRAQAGTSFWFSNWTNANNDGMIDEWLISPRIPDIAAGDTLRFWAGAIDNGFDDSIRVFISTTDSALTSFTNQIAYLKVQGPIGSWHEYSFDLSPFAGMDIFLAVNYYLVSGGPTGANSDNLWIDHFLVSGSGTAPAVVTTSVLQNPALPKYADVVVVSALMLQTTPAVDVWIGTDTLSLALSPLPGSDRSFHDGFEFTQTGTYTLATAVDDPALQETFFRTFNVSLARPGESLVLQSVDGVASLHVPGHGLTEETWLLADTAFSTDGMIYRFGPAAEIPEPFVLEFSYSSREIPGVFRETADGWEELPAQTVPGSGTVRVAVNALGTFRLGASENGNAPTPLPAVSSLNQNYPNPFNPSTAIAYEVAGDGPVSLVLYDISGRTVRMLVDEFRYAGRYEAVWDGTNQDGLRVASGVYLYRLTTADLVRTRKLMLLR